MEQDHSFNEWINRLADNNRYELEDNTVIIENAGYWIEFIYPSGKKQWEFIFYPEILN
jgi:hypothetical protein